MMHMSFWWSYNFDHFLFRGFEIKSVVGFVATCVAVGSIAFLFEYLRYLQAKQRQKELFLRSQQLKTLCPSESSALLTDSSSPNPVPVDPAAAINFTLLDRSILLGTDLSLWFLLQNTAYILMLSVMLYNGWLFLSAVIGGGCGYFVFGQMFMKLNLQNCQIIRETFCMTKCAESEAQASNRDGDSTPALEMPTTSQGTLACNNKIVVNVNVHAIEGDGIETCHD